MRTLLCAAAVAAAFLADGRPARADRDPPIVPEGELLAGMALEVNLERARDADPLAVARVRLGLADRWSTGVFASLSLTDGPDHPLCAACDHPRGGVFGDVAFLLLDRAMFRLAARSRFGAASFDPVHLALAPGVAGRFGSARWWIDFDGSVSAGLTGRDTGNEAFVDLPLWLCGQLTPRGRAYLRTGFFAPLSGLSDSWAVPIGAGAAVIAGRWEIGIEGWFPRLLGPINTGRYRGAFAFVRARLPVGH